MYLPMLVTMYGWETTGVTLTAESTRAWTQTACLTTASGYIRELISKCDENVHQIIC